MSDLHEITPGMLDRAQGCLLGQVAGDSLGSQVEFSSADYLRWKFPEGVRELQDGGVWCTLAGQLTDDSELALMLARTLVRDKRYDPNAAFAAYLDWYRSGPFDIGNTIGAALGRRSPNAESQSNGSLMRISPLGIFAARYPAKGAEWARADSRLTHPHQVCQDACAVYVIAIATAIGREATPRDCYRAALDEADRSGADECVRDALKKAHDLPPEVCDEDNQGWVLLALQNAFYQLLYAVNIEEGIVDTVQRGGDTDTTAAIAGALLGAVHGRQGVPQRWMDTILNCRPKLPLVPGRHHYFRPEEFWPVDALELAASLVRGPE
jgi:ADP-ribosylglycohydrolase